MTAFPTGGALIAASCSAMAAMISAARPIMTWVSLRFVRVTSKVQRLGRRFTGNLSCKSLGRNRYGVAGEPNTIHRHAVRTGRLAGPVDRASARGHGARVAVHLRGQHHRAGGSNNAESRSKRCPVL